MWEAAMVMDWSACLREREAKPIQHDEEMALSLRKTSEDKAYAADLLELNERTAASKVSLAYDAVRELLESLALASGFKIYNHVCYGGFLQEILKRTELAEEFNDLRKIRNDINYYGKEVSIAEAKQIVGQLTALRSKLLKL